MAREFEGGGRLDGWKAIAAFFGRDERTVKRWEAQRGLPIHRIPGGGRAAVWAHGAELKRWLEGEPGVVAAASDVPREPDRRWLMVGLTVGVVAAAVGAGWLLSRGSAPEPDDELNAYAGDPATQALYMRALLAWDSRTPAGLAAAVRDLDEVIRRRPDRAEGYAKLADCYLLMREFGVMPEAEAYGRAEAAAQRAIRIDPQAAGALRALAFIRFWWRADPAALGLFERALELEPDSTQTRQWYANALSARGQHAAALAQLRAARMASPAEVSLWSAEAQARAAAGDAEGALRDLDHLARAYPDSIPVHRAGTWVRLRAGDLPGFLRESEAEASLRRDAARIAAMRKVRAAYEQGGPRALFTALAEAEIEARESGRGNAVMAAYYWALAGNAREARRWLATARERREPDIIFLPSLPELARLEASPVSRR